MYAVKFHPEFFKDLDKLSTAEIRIYDKKKRKIQENPLRLKHLSGRENCYREPITSNIRIIYYLEGTTIWMLTIQKHDDAYDAFRRRLHTLKTKFFP